MLGSFETGVGTSLETGSDSVETASGLCAPAPELFLTDGASLETGSFAVETAAQPPDCGGCEDTLIYDVTYPEHDSVGGPTPPDGAGSVIMGNLNVPYSTFPVVPTLKLVITGEAAITLPDVINGAVPTPPDGADIYMISSQLGFPSLVWHSTVSPSTSFAPITMVAQADNSTPFVLGTAPGFDWHLTLVSALYKPAIPPPNFIAQGVKFRNIRVRFYIPCP